MDFKLKEGSSVIKEYMSIPNIEHYLNREHRVHFYHWELDTYYEIGYNPREPRKVFKDGFEDTMISIEMVEGLFRRHSSDWKNLSDEVGWEIGQFLHGFMNQKLPNGKTMGVNILTSHYNDFIIHQPSFHHTSLFQKQHPTGHFEGFCDLPIQIHRDSERGENKWLMKTGRWIDTPKDFKNKETKISVSSKSSLDKDTMMDLIKEGGKRVMNSPYIRQNVKVGRNEPCICGSGIKFKKCCLN